MPTVQFSEIVSRHHRWRLQPGLGRWLSLEVHLEFGMTVDLEMFDFDQEVAIPWRFEGGLVPFGSVPRPVLDDDLAIHPHPDAVVAGGPEHPFPLRK